MPVNPEYRKQMEDRDRDLLVRLTKASTLRRFWAKVLKGAPDECWPWQGSIHPRRGYGRWGITRDKDNKGYQAHRVAAILCNGMPPTDKPFTCHTCDNPPCCNPKHLFWGDDVDNQQDAIKKGRNSYGEKHPLCKVTDAEVRYIRSTTRPEEELVSAFKITRTHVIHLRQRRRRKTVSEETI